ncbi:hypothetical protein AMTRI_Chr02g221460 [Amborella trichopoda]|uniref:3'-5' exonuclease domain-containing protein n=1 Tax=Amborella trichopoda TaxID=13333 RepID=U5D5T1_AMBTC|nr:uncharacterized protein LOC18445118 [Amborella trichopoda]ERN16792.1 hypothetical protein AMTR_s00057p00084850 [Amborella trichopoda]|eukprot:XP_006855325.1 uncharacterized protein LOC18445118 [Amborella trichopoda]
MGLEEANCSEENGDKKEKLPQIGTITLHCFSDLSRTLPTTFVYLLKECYIHGTFKATAKFRILQQQVVKALDNAPPAGPSNYIVQCLYVLPIFGPAYAEGFSHLLLSSLRRFCRLHSSRDSSADSSEAKILAAHLFLDVLAGLVIQEERILMKLLEDFDIKLKDIGRAICGSVVHADCSRIAKERVENYIFQLIESQSYINAVHLLERFSLRICSQSLLDSMIKDSQFKAAEKWATFMGKQMVCYLIQWYIDKKMLKDAYTMIKENCLKQEFPDAYYQYKEISMKKLAEKGCWDVAEFKTNNDQQLLLYLVYLALEAGYSEKVADLCARYSLEGFSRDPVPEASPPPTRYLHLSDLNLEDVIWVENVERLIDATCQIEGNKVVGIDCEWRPNYVKGREQNKVSILQIASERKVFIIDLIKLSKDDPNSLNSCIRRILCSHRILKLGYNLQCDLHQLSYSYEELECFQHYDMLLDVQKMFKESRGGLSGLTKKILGAGLNKTRRNSNWEQRPLHPNQLEYAALDAAVLIPIFHHVCSQPNTTSAKTGRPKFEWKSHIVSHLSNTKSFPRSQS